MNGIEKSSEKTLSRDPRARAPRTPAGRGQGQRARAGTRPGTLGAHRRTRTAVGARGTPRRTKETRGGLTGPPGGGGGRGRSPHRPTWARPCAGPWRRGRCAGTGESRAAARGRRGAWSPPSSAASPGTAAPWLPPPPPRGWRRPPAQGAGREPDTQLPAESGGGGGGSSAPRGRPRAAAGGGKVRSAPLRGVLAAQVTDSGVRRAARTQRQRTGGQAGRLSARRPRPSPAPAPTPLLLRGGGDGPHSHGAAAALASLYRCRALPSSYLWPRPAPPQSMPSPPIGSLAAPGRDPSLRIL